MHRCRSCTIARSLAGLFALLCIAASFATSEPELPRCPVDVGAHEATCGERVEDVSKSWWSSMSVGTLGIPVIYTKNLITQAFSSNQTWSELLCGSGQTHCASSEWPGPSAHIVGNHDAVTALGKLLPTKTWNGAWWRGSELALWLISPAVHYQTDDTSSKPMIDPPAIGLGALPRQHAVMRRMIMRFVNMDGWDDAKRSRVTHLIETSAQQVIEKCKNQQKLAATDISIWFQKTLHKIIFDVNITDEYAADFDSIGKGYVPASLLSYSVSKFVLSKDPFNLKSRQQRVRPYLNSLREWLETKYMDLFESGDCSPSRSCLDQGVLGTFDMLQFAGGLSIPSSLMTSLSLLYSTSPMNPARESPTSGFSYAPGEELQYYWEVSRWFPPVDSVPFWDVRPYCKGMDRNATDLLNKPNGKTDACPLGSADNKTGYPNINLYAGGRRWLLSLALAMRDPAIWGADANKFRLLPLELYEKHSVLFLEMAQDSTVADGRADRSCPGKKLALLMAQSFLKAFKKEEWATSPNSEIVLQQAVPYVKPYALFPKRVIQECLEKTCNCADNMGFIRRKLCSRCTAKHCPK